MIELILARRGKAKKELSLFFSPVKTEIAKEYLSALSLYSGAVNAILEPDRTYNFPGDPRDQAWIARAINRCITTINKFSPGLIKHRARTEMSQSLMNELHHYFERYRGSVIEPAEFFLKAPAEVQDALHELNILIHRYEDLQRGQGLSPRIVVTFKAFQRAELEAGDFKHFTKREIFGRWYIDYCELGKPLWDVYQDRDEVVGDQNIRPLKYFSANALIHFGPSMSERETALRLQGFHKWWAENRKFLAGLGFKKGDPRNAIGNIPVADLRRDLGALKGLNQAEAVKLIGQFPLIRGVVVHNALRKNQNQ